MSSISQRLSQTVGLFGGSKSPEDIPWDPDNTQLPTRKQLPKIPNAPEGAAWFWGKDDYVGVQF